VTGVDELLTLVEFGGGSLEIISTGR